MLKVKRFKWNGFTSYINHYKKAKILEYWERQRNEGKEYSGIELICNLQMKNGINISSKHYLKQRKK